MKTYLKRLKHHPGVPIAFAMTALGALAGLSRESMPPFMGMTFGATIMGLVSWPVVLWTARTQPLPRDD